jgi:S-adenosylmethionine:tRNA ribosyltransferase-isomerase
MESEYYQISSAAASLIHKTREKGGRIVAVGTTVCRALESAIRSNNAAGYGPKGTLGHQEGWTDLFIYPPFPFQLVDILMTNFHLPCGTPVMLTSAFAGWDLLKKAYQEAIRLRYRFYSYGDAMLII